MTPEINQPTIYASSAWKNAVAQIMGEPFELPHVVASRVHRGKASMQGKDTGVDLDELFVQVFEDDTDAMDNQEFND